MKWVLAGALSLGAGILLAFQRQRKKTVADARMNWSSFVENFRIFFDEERNDDMHRLIEAVDDYTPIAPQYCPFSHSESGEGPGDLYTKCLFVCHKAFLSAATATASSLPEDGEAITRRALEAAKTCVAVKA